MRLLFLLSVIFFVVSAGAGINDDLRNAAHRSNLAEVNRLLEAGADPNAKGNNDYTPLHRSYNAEITSALLAAGADPNAKNKNGRTPLQSTYNAEITSALLAAGADPNTKDNYGYTPLHRAYNAEITSALLAAGADSNAKNNNGETPLHEARNAEIAAALLAAGADPNAKDMWGKTPLHKARNNAEITSALLAAGADSNAKNNNGSTPEIAGIINDFSSSQARENLQYLKGCTYTSGSKDNPVKAAFLKCGTRGICVGTVNCSFDIDGVRMTRTFQTLCRSSEGECPSATDCAVDSDFTDLEELTSPEESSSSRRSEQSGGVQ